MQRKSPEAIIEKAKNVDADNYNDFVTVNEKNELEAKAAKIKNQQTIVSNLMHKKDISEYNYKAVKDARETVKKCLRYTITQFHMPKIGPSIKFFTTDFYEVVKLKRETKKNKKLFQKGVEELNHALIKFDFANSHAARIKMVEENKPSKKTIVRSVSAPVNMGHKK